MNKCKIVGCENEVYSFSDEYCKRHNHLVSQNDFRIGELNNIQEYTETSKNA